MNSFFSAESDSRRSVRIALAAAVLLISATGYATGRWLDRWGPSPDLESAVSALKQTPMEFGDWIGEEMETSPDVIRAAEVSSSLSRRYIHRKTGATVTIALVCGRAVPVTRHTPNYCYPAAGYAPTDEPWQSEIAIDGKPDRAEFIHCNYVKPNAALPTGISILWAYGSDGQWIADESARYLYVAKRTLYKLYVIRDTSGLATAPKDLDADGFVREFLPALTRALWTRNGSENTASRSAEPQH